MIKIFALNGVILGYEWNIVPQGFSSVLGAAAFKNQFGIALYGWDPLNGGKSSIAVRYRSSNKLR